MHRGSCVLRTEPLRLWLLREASLPPAGAPGPYENEGSERVCRGSIALPSGACWSSKLQVTIRGDESALLTVRRQAAEPGVAPDEAALVIPSGEADALVALLQGLIAQARRDGVLPDAQAS